MDKYNINDYENSIVTRAKQLYNEKNYLKSYKNCIRESIHELFNTNMIQFYSIFGIYENDYINYLLEKYGG